MIKFKVGEWYQLVADKGQRSAGLAEAINDGRLKFPEGGLFQCEGLTEYDSCLSSTEGVLWKGDSCNEHGEIIMCAALCDLEAGAFVKVENKNSPSINGED